LASTLIHRLEVAIQQPDARTPILNRLPKGITFEHILDAVDQYAATLPFKGGERDDDDEDEDWGDDHSWNGESAPTTPTPSSPTPTPSQPVTTFTMAEVATHANAQSCYTTVSGGVYDVTSYIPIHKGGSAAILAICGKDGSSLFAGQHAGEPKPEQALASFKIGTLVQ
jgi:cytochrome b involved in lipid metabolism